MKFLKQTSFLILMLIIMGSFSQCSTAQKLQKDAPTQFEGVYCENWTAGVRGGGSGLNIFIPVNDKSVVLDSVYFRGKASKLSSKSGDGVLYIGRFKTDFNQQKDMILSSDSKEEYKNKLPKKLEKIPFELSDNECVVSYIEDGETKYYKIQNVEQREPTNFPMSSPQGDIKKN